MAKVLRYFLGTNSPQGYVSRFDQLGEENDWRRWVVTGGSAQARTTVITRAAESAFPRCKTGEDILSTGDPDRLAGAAFPDLHTAILDGDPPGGLPLRCPGAWERVVPLWDLLDQGQLWERREEVRRLTGERERLERDAGGYLYAAGALTRDLASVGGAAMDREKLLAYARRLALREFPHSSSGTRRGREQTRFLSALTGRGPILLRETVTAAVPRTIAIEDNHGAVANALLEALLELALEAGLDPVVCRCPLFPFSKTDHLLLPQLGLGFLTLNRATLPALEGVAERTIHASRFSDTALLRERRARSGFLRKAATGMLEQAGELLRQTEEVRSALDGIYQAAMDRDSVEDLARRVAEELAEP